MDFFTLLKFLHVSLAIVWLGGGFALMLAGMLTLRTACAQDIVGLLRAAAFLGQRLYLPASLATLGSGVALVVLAGQGWPAWTVLALVGVGFTALFGALVLGPWAEAALKAADEHGPTAVIAPAQRLFQLSKLDFAVQFAIVFLMVDKPAWSEVTVLVGLVMMIALATIAAFRPSPRAA